MKLHVPNMSCGHCVANIEKAVKDADPAAVVRADLKLRTVEIDANLPTASLIRVLSDAGYPTSMTSDQQSL